MCSQEKLKSPKWGHASLLIPLEEETAHLGPLPLFEVFHEVLHVLQLSFQVPLPPQSQIQLPAQEADVGFKERLQVVGT